MTNQKFFSENVKDWHKYLSKIDLTVPSGYQILNPFEGTGQQKIRVSTDLFYQHFYHDKNPRRIIIGSSPARRGSALTGIPFEDSDRIAKITGMKTENYHIQKGSSNFLERVMEEFGGIKKFYSTFYMTFVCPVGIEKRSDKGRLTNVNYYENKKLLLSLQTTIIESLKMQLDFGIDNSTCYCIGSGENYKYLTRLNSEFRFFERIIPLEHPRFIMQYNSNKTEYYLKKYLDALMERKR